LNSLAIIPARGGSKRIPRKNIKEFLGKPIISYTIQAAVSSNLFDEVMVSTDDEEIASVATQFGAKVPFMRSKENSDDYATTADVLREVVTSYEKKGSKFTNACCLYATAPFIKSERLLEGHAKLTSGNFDSVFPIVRFSYPIWRALQTTGNRVSMIWEENLTKRSQDLPPAFHDAGQWYWFNCQALLKKGRLWTDNSFGLEISELEVQDIDTETDWKLAELKYRLTSGDPS
jgi:pseudaminic acid cytidylyltransferase